MHEGSVLLAIAWRVLKGLWNDKRSVALIVAAPVLVMLIFGFAFAGDLRGARLIVVVEDPLFDANVLLDSINREFFSVELLDSRERAIEEIRGGRSYAALIVPGGFVRNLTQGSAKIEIYLDGSNSMASDRVVAELRRTFASLSASLGLRAPLSQSVKYVYGEGARFIDAFMPGVVSISIFFFSIFLTLVSFVSERRSNTLLRLYASPAREIDIILGYSLAFSVVAAFQVIELFLVSMLVFDVKIKGSPLVAIATGSLLSISGVNLGLLLSSLVRNEAQAPQVMPLITLPSILLSGVFWPIEAIPEWLRPLSYAMPPTYAIEAMRSVVVRGWGLSEISGELLILALFAAIFMAIGTVALSRRE